MGITVNWKDGGPAWPADVSDWSVALAAGIMPGPGLSKDGSDREAEGLDLVPVRSAMILVGARWYRAAEAMEIERTTGSGGEVTLRGDWSRVAGVGAGWRAGVLVVESAVGDRAGACMSGGEVRIAGAAGDDAGQRMIGGRLVIGADAGDRLGGPGPGTVFGMNRGMIVVRGNAGRLAGWRMRRGTVLVGGDCGELAGYELRGGNLVIGGRAGPLAGEGCRRGTIAALGGAPGLSSGFRRVGRFDPLFLRLLARRQAADWAAVGLGPPSSAELNAGDRAFGSRGECWVPVAD